MLPSAGANVLLDSAAFEFLYLCCIVSLCVSIYALDIEIHFNDWLRLSGPAWTYNGVCS